MLKLCFEVIGVLCFADVFVTLAILRSTMSRALNGIVSWRLSFLRYRVLCCAVSDRPWMEVLHTTRTCSCLVYCQKAHCLVNWQKANCLVNWQKAHCLVYWQKAHWPMLTASYYHNKKHASFRRTARSLCLFCRILHSWDGEQVFLRYSFCLFLRNAALRESRWAVGRWRRDRTHLLCLSETWFRCQGGTATWSIVLYLPSGLSSTWNCIELA